MLKRCITGDFEPGEVVKYVVFEVIVFWGLIFHCWLIYPAENHYSIMTHTFSFLGSFESKHNPGGWWLFSIAMIFWGLATVPLVLYLYRRFTAISRWGARAGAFLMLVGCAGIVLVALFPDVPPRVVGEWRSTDIHEKATLLIVAGFLLGIPWYGILLLKDRFFPGPSGGDYFEHRNLLWPYLVWLAVVGAAAHFQIKWEYVYAAKKAAAAASGAHIGSHWSEALNTRYSFPLWENLVVYTLFLVMVWLPLAVPEELPPPDTRA